MTRDFETVKTAFEAVTRGAQDSDNPATYLALLQAAIETLPGAQVSFSWRTIHDLGPDASGLDQFEAQSRLMSAAVGYEEPSAAAAAVAESVRSAFGQDAPCPG